MPLPLVLVTHPRERLATYFGEQALANLRGVARVQLNPDAHDWSTQELIEAAQGCDVLIAYRQTALDREFFAAVPRLLAAVRCAVDIRTINVAAASHEGILVTQASPGFGPAVAEWVIGVMIDLSRSISAAAAAYWQGQSIAPRMGRELRGACLGIIGYGVIGRQLARLAQVFGMRVCVYDPYVQSSEPALESVGWHELLACADHLVCLAPATPETDKMINAQALSRMKPSAFFINASRGQLVDEQALLQALNRGMLAGAALDVGCAPDQMPTPELASHPLVIATPHVGGLTPQAIAHQALETVEQTRAILQGLMPHGAVNPASAVRLNSRMPS
jgi:D-3-phosphoglycerate dehydrogenase / 2-oxoglutarate reductase